MATVSDHPSTVAYFSMEIALDPAMPTYSGGFGVLAGDTVRSAADLGIPLVAVTLVHRKGYFRQRLDSHGNQIEAPADWHPEKLLEPVAARVTVLVEGRQVQVQAWRYRVQGVSGHMVPVYLLDTALPENAPWDQTLTDHLYDDRPYYRLCQEAILGFGGLALLRALGYTNIQTYHINEGHSALLTLALLAEHMRGRALPTMTDADKEAVRQRCVFTTHTPLPAGHDQFPLGLVRQVLGEEWATTVSISRCCPPDVLNMTFLAMTFARFINAVSVRHEKVARIMFSGYPIHAITNGVHAVTWTAPAFARLYDRYIPQWRHDNFALHNARSIPLEEIQEAHAEAKRELLAEVERRTGERLDPHALTIGFARRATGYKRGDLLFTDPDRLKRIAERVGPLQVIYGGKAHPHDEDGKAIIRTIFQAARAVRNGVRVVYLEEYDIALAKYIIAGVDLWLNTPRKPLEASGTSGMKAALNGVPSLSVLDGWWVEGHIEGVTGWAIGDDAEGESDPQQEAESLYTKLEYVIAPLFYNRPRAFAEIMRTTIALNGSYFHTQRMMLQYLWHAYRTPSEL